MAHIEVEDVEYEGLPTGAGLGVTMAAGALVRPLSPVQQTER